MEKLVAWRSTGIDAVNAINELIERVERLEMKNLTFEDVPVITEVDYEDKFNTGPQTREMKEITVNKSDEIVLLVITTKRDISMRRESKTYQLVLTPDQALKLARMLEDEYHAGN